MSSARLRSNVYIGPFQHSARRVLHFSLERALTALPDAQGLSDAKLIIRSFNAQELDAARSAKAATGQLRVDSLAGVLLLNRALIEAKR